MLAGELILIASVARWLVNPKLVYQVQAIYQLYSDRTRLQLTNTASNTGYDVYLVRSTNGEFYRIAMIDEKSPGQTLNRWPLLFGMPRPRTSTKWDIFSKPLQ